MYPILRHDVQRDKYSGTCWMNSLLGSDWDSLYRIFRWPRYRYHYPPHWTFTRIYSADIGGLPG
ncbi:hypothetical protein ARMSODRAFT_448719 [Armillaria solidipes]|uniref:Uncharacterized protein n=1 Tax=Armillaria solidipes TaxID=1076256 RepID=A0A2H3BD36_9AGAR|nr:hypothetical protein ARMSODRAFT_448719 [Armillaria solidipes]